MPPVEGNGNPLQYPRKDAITSGWRYTSDLSDYQSYYTGIYLSYREGGVQDYQTNASSAAEDTGLSYDLGYNAFLQIDDDTTRRAILKVIIDSQKDLNFAPFTVSAPLNPCFLLGPGRQGHGSCAVPSHSPFSGL